MRILPRVCDLVDVDKELFAPSKGERIYVNRSGRRRIVNEDALIRMLEGYGFAVMEDKPRTLSETGIHLQPGLHDYWSAWSLFCQYRLVRTRDALN